MPDAVLYLKIWNRDRDIPGRIELVDELVRSARYLVTTLEAHDPSFCLLGLSCLPSSYLEV